MSWICKHCIYSRRLVIKGTTMWYCKAHQRYCYSKKFVEAWGCDEYKDRQLTLFMEEETNGK